MNKAALFIVLSLAAVSARAETIVEAGAGFLNWGYSEGQALIVAERFAGKYDIGIGAIERQVCDCRDYKPDLDRETSIDPLSFIYAQRIFSGNRLEFGLGFGFWNQTSRVSGSILMFPLSIKYRVWKRLSIGVRHFSNASSGVPNLGQDMMTLSWNFGGK